ncbi:MAG: hypothetical protein ACQETL_18985 [Bacteroidota bacterium]
MTLKYKKKDILIICSLLAGLLGFLVKIIYRPLIVENNINDYGFQGFAPNLFYTIGACLFAAYWVKKGQIKTMIFVTVGVLVYETEQIWTSRTFDYLDVLATIIGLGISIPIFKGLSNKDEF